MSAHACRPVGLHVWWLKTGNGNIRLKSPTAGELCTRTPTCSWCCVVCLLLSDPPVPAVQPSAAQHHHVGVTGLNILGNRGTNTAGTAAGRQGSGLHMAGLHLQPHREGQSSMQGC